MPFKLKGNLLRQYSERKRFVNSCLSKKQAILLSSKPLASHFDPRSCDDKDSGIKVTIAQILPFIALISCPRSPGERKRHCERKRE